MSAGVHARNNENGVQSPDVKAFPHAGELQLLAERVSWQQGECWKTRLLTEEPPYFRATLNQSAWAGSRKKQSDFQRRYEKLSPRLHHKGAIVAVAHAMVYAIYNVLHYRRPYRPSPTADGPDQQRTQRLIRHHTRRLKQLEA
jgi:hypothetical protein